jgi:hypothetical protein
MSSRPYVRNFTKKFGQEQAAELREVFTDKPAKRKNLLDWSWPKTVRRVGDGLAVMYRSDKWRAAGDYEHYKHICESKTPWTLYAAPRFELSGVDIVGESEAVPAGWMPNSIAVLALFLGIQVRLYKKSGHSLFLPKGDEGIYEVKIANAKLAGARTEAGDFFLTIYDRSGPQLFLFGEELDVEKDGIVG